MPHFIKPGAVIGIIGGGVRAYHLVLAARKLGMHAIVMAPADGDIAFEVADMRLLGGPTDTAALQRLVALAQVITFVDENVDGTALAAVARPEQLPSGIDIFSVTQDRYLEKVFLDDLNMNILPYAQVVTPNDIAAAVETVGFPAILKPIQKGIGVDQQLRLLEPEDVKRAEQLLQQRPYVLEAWLDEPTEYSVLVAKSGETIKVMPVVENQFSNHELRSSVVPAAGGAAVMQEIQRIARVLAEKIDYNGVFGIELFMTASLTLYVKRIFPGPQMNGHILAATTGISEYTMHLRALLGWPLPDVTLLRGGALLPLRKADRAAAMTQIQIKPAWQFDFYPEGDPLIGQIAVLGDRDAIKNTINATDYFQL
ncbi:ATP-grasp domain-containing protein [Lacticaseibacillus baoqingensis]|uniref:ATP-grasp domain-containing protein n=1 Tax=Lacticaseibacillus baoqingensis TaxID=2486013 RepID=A0ABW4E4I7_9LACO|nr:ATP-grasp domain-containing protein [Lacticaseibacillus baoqingensis]